MPYNNRRGYEEQRYCGYQNFNTRYRYYYIKKKQQQQQRQQQQKLKYGSVKDKQFLDLYDAPHKTHITRKTKGGHRKKI